MISCRMCESKDLEEYLDLGFTPPADQFLRKEQLAEPEVYYPLRVVVCKNCGLSQLDYIVSPEVLYRHDYPYEMSITKMGHVHWAEFAKSVTNMLKLGKEDLVIDVGSNVGVLLEEFRNNGTKILGVDPASNIVRIAEKRGIETMCEFFSVDVAKRILEEKGKASLIVGTNVFAHIDNLSGLMKAVGMLLNKRGVFIFESPYFVNLVKRLEYDTIYHEHLSYLSIKPLVKFLARFGMEVFDVQERDIHGGSFRVFIDRKGYRPVSAIVKKLLVNEEKEKIHDIENLRRFARKVEKNRRDLNELLASLKHKGKKIAAVSAPAKGMTLLNYCHIGPEVLEFITEKSTLKIGRFSPGLHLPVVPDSELTKQKIDYALLLAWNFSSEIINNLSDYKKRGGKFIIPIPGPRIV